MKVLDKTNRVIKLGDIGEESAFHIATTATAFEILSSKIYKYPERAVLREYACNAFDAHVYVNKKSVPFEIHLPTQFEPFLSIRDFGPGLDKTGIVELFTTYFNSNKIQSNDFIGAMGLGSKSAFTVCDNFTATSWYDGVKFQYALYLNEDRKPAYSLISENQTTESNGLEVKIPVKSGDIHKYEQEALQLFKYWDLMPTFIGKKPHITKDTPNLKGKNWYTTERYTSHARAGIYSKVLMGHVSYPFDILQLKNVGDTAKKLFNCGLIIRLPIGSVQVAASREELNYHKQTIQRLEHELAVIEQEYADTVQKQIDQAAHYYDACLLASKMPIFPNKAKYKGRQVEVSHSVNFSKTVMHFVHKSWGKKRSSIQQYVGPTNLNIGNITRFYEKDIDLTSHIRCEQEVERSSSDVFLVEPDDIKELTTKLGYPANLIPKVSSLTHTKLARKNYKVTGIYEIEEIPGTSYTPSRFRWKAATVDFSVTPKGYYIGFFDRMIHHDTHRLSIGAFKEVKQYLTAIGIKLSTVYGVQKDKMNKFKKQGWVNVLDLVTEDSKKWLQDPAFASIHQKCVTFGASTMTNEMMGFIKYVENKTLNPGALKDLIDIYKDYELAHRTYNQKLEALKYIEAHLGGKIAQVQPLPTLQQKLTDIEVKYDLFWLLMRNRIKPERIYQYIADTDVINQLRKP